MTEIFIQGAIDDIQSIGKGMTEGSARLLSPLVFHKDDFKLLAWVILRCQGIQNAGEQVEPAVKIDDTADFDRLVPLCRKPAISLEIKGGHAVDATQHLIFHCIDHSTTINIRSARRFPQSLQ